MHEAAGGVSMVAGYRVLEVLGVSKRFQAFRVEMGPQDPGAGTLYMMHDVLPQPDAFVATVNAIWSAWPFEIPAQRGFVLPEAQVWKNRPWFVVPDSVPLLSKTRGLSSAAVVSLREQLDWLSVFQPPGGLEGDFAHGDVRTSRIGWIEAEPFLIAPGWVAACDLALGRNLAHTRADDAYHLAKLLVHKLDLSPLVEDAADVAPPTPRAQVPVAAAAAEPVVAPAVVTPLVVATEPEARWQWVAGALAIALILAVAAMFFFARG